MYYPDQKYIDYLDTMQELLENKEKNVLLYQGENLKVNIEDNKEEIETIGIKSDTTTYEFIFEKNKNVQ